MFKGTLDKKYRYIAKDFDGTWYLFENKPVISKILKEWKMEKEGDIKELPLIPCGLETIYWEDSLHILIYEEEEEKVTAYYVGK
jgi:hypothetical protein